MSTQEIGSPQSQNRERSFYLSRGFSTGSDFIYDETYKNYRTKQKFEKDPKYSYFNAIMKMKRKLSSKQQLYRNIFTPKGQQTPQAINDSPQFYHSNNHNLHDAHRLTLFKEPLDHEIIRIQQLKKNSFRIVKEQMPLESVVGLKKQNSDIVTTMNVNKRTPSSQIISSLRSGHKSNMSLYEKTSTYNGNGPFTNFEMTTKSRSNNRSYVELQIKQQQPLINSKSQSYQPSNPKPRLDEILSEYRKMNKHSVKNIKQRRSSLPKEFVQKLYQTNRMFYKSNLNKKRISIG